MGNGMDKVLEGLYVGSIRDSTDRKQLDENRITHILSVFNKPRPMISDRVYLCITAQDNADQELSQHFPECNDFIHQARVNGGRVLVHCLAGVSRSVTLVIAYVIAVTSYGWREGYNIVHAAHRASSPNFGFQRQLLRFQYETLSMERDRLKKKWPPSAYDDHAMCQKWLLVHEKWVQGGDKAVYESSIYPLPYNSFCVRAKASDALANQNAASEHYGTTCTVVPYPELPGGEEETTAPIVETSDMQKNFQHGSDNKPPMLRSVQVHKSQLAQLDSTPEIVSMTTLSEFFEPSSRYKEEQERKQKYSARMMEHQSRNNPWNNSAVSASTTDEGSSGHMTNDIPESFSEKCEEPESTNKALLDDLFASPLD